MADAPFLNLERNKEAWAKNLHEEDFDVLCKDGTRKPVKDAESCHLARAPNHAVVSRKDKATCVEKILNKQQVWTSQGLQTVFIVWVWIIEGYHRREAHTPVFFSWKLELGRCGWWTGSPRPGSTHIFCLLEIRPQLTHVFQGPSICLLARP